VTAAPAAASAAADAAAPPPPEHRDWRALVLPAAVLAIAAAVIVAAMAGTTFFYDEWIWIMQRRSFNEASLLEPFNNHLMAVPIATFAVFYRVFGLDSPFPYQLALLAGHLATCGLLYVYLRHRIGWVVALAGAAALAFFGYTWPVIIWPISLGWVYATTAGIAALLLVDRDTRRSDAGAMAALLVGIASSGIAVPFVIGLGIELALRRAWRRLYVAFVPLVVFGAWYLAYATGTSDSGSAGDVVEFAEKLLAQTFGTLLGVDDRGTAAHVVLAIGFVAIVVLWFALGRPHSPRLVGNAAALASFTVLLSYSRATSGLTQWHSYAAAVFVLLTLGELLSGRTIAVVPTLAVLAVVAWSIVWNLGELHEGSDVQRHRAEEMRAQLAAVELAGRSMDPNVRVGRFLLETRAGPWLGVAAQYGSPAYSLDELRAAPPHARRAADRLLVEHTDVALDGASSAGVCSADPTGDLSAGPLEITLQGTTSGGDVRVGVLTAGRSIGVVEPGQRVSVLLPGLGGGARWHLALDGSAELCTVTPAS
jgi:hypothetical protein